MTLDDLRGRPGEKTRAVAERAHRARRIQHERYAGSGAVNASLPDRAIRRHCRLAEPAQRLVDRAFERLGLSARGLTRLLKVARTIADLGRRDRIGAADVAEAIQYRTLDRDPFE